MSMELHSMLTLFPASSPLGKLTVMVDVFVPRAKGVQWGPPHRPRSSMVADVNLAVGSETLIRMAGLPLAPTSLNVTSTPLGGAGMLVALAELLPPHRPLAGAQCRTCKGPCTLKHHHPLLAATLGGKSSDFTSNSSQRRWQKGRTSLGMILLSD